MGSILRLGLVLIAFSAIFSEPSTSQECGGNFTDEGSIMSPNYPAMYPTNSKCTWTLTAAMGMVIAIDFATFDLEDGFDWLYIYISPPAQSTRLYNRFTGRGFTGPMTLASVVTVVFTSDSTIQGKGCYIRFSSVASESLSFPPQTTMVDVYSGCGGNLSGEGYFSSPGYPNPYPDGIVCEWTLSANPGKVISLQLLDVSTERGFDFLRIYDTALITFATSFLAYTGILSPTTVTRGRTVTAIFTSDDSSALGGFLIKFSSVAPPPTTAPPMSTQPAVCGGQIVGNGCLTSPNYPSSYPDNSFCEWKLVAASGKLVQLQFSDFRLEKVWDTLSVYDTLCPTTSLAPVAKYSGNGTKSCATFTPSVTVIFSSDESIQMKGFSIKFTSVRAPKPTAYPPVSPAAGICGQRASVSKGRQRRVVGGRPAAENGFPWQVMLRYKGLFVCGGSLLTNRWIVTAAHCIPGTAPLYDSGGLSVFLGKLNANVTDSGEVQRQVIKVIRHPDFAAANNDNDIALVRLATPVSFTNSIRPICLPSSDAVTNDICYATGWGTTAGTGWEAILKQAALPVVNRTACRSYLGSSFTKNMLCAGYLRGGLAACHGDSGGPFACEKNGRFVLQGIVSWSNGCGAAFAPGVYTRVIGYVEWIHAIIAGN